MLFSWGIIEDAKKEKKVTFKNCYTNINEFNFDKIENVNPLDFEQLYKILTRLHTHYKAKKTDKYLVRYVAKLKLKDTLFVIDEAHNHFDKKDLILVWWLSYHRHLYHEIILITQNLALIESKYKSFSEFFYVAKPQSLTLDKRFFKYNVFCSSRLTVASRSGAFKVKRNKNVFALYKSGDSINASNVILKFIFIAFLFLLFIFGVMYFFISDKVPSSTKTIEKVEYKSSNNTSQNAVLQVEIKNSYSDAVFVKISCSKSLCTNKEISIPPQLLRIFIDKKDMKILYQEQINLYNTVFYLCKPPLN